MYSTAEIKTLPHCLIFFFSGIVNYIFTVSESSEYVVFKKTGLDQTPLAFPSPLIWHDDRRAVNISDATSPSSFSYSSAGHEVCARVCVCACMWLQFTPRATSKDKSVHINFCFDSFPQVTLITMTVIYYKNLNLPTSKLVLSSCDWWDSFSAFWQLTKPLIGEMVK